MPSSSAVLPRLTRRNFMKTAGAAAAAVAGSSVLPGLSLADVRTFPAGFLWGVAGSAAETESRQGRGRSNWDVFIDDIGGSRDGSTNVRNTEFETRYQDEFRQLRDAGVNGFRFSFSWPRIQPEAAGAPNAAGLAVYDRIVDSMLEHGLEPYGTAFHWDVPVWAGDFRDRDMVHRMAEYVDILTRKFGDRISNWLMFNEPCALATFGYAFGTYAPGYRSREALGAAIHHINLAQGLAFAAARANLPSGTRVSSAFNVQPAVAVSGKAEDIAAARFMDELWNWAFLDPVYGKGYPDLIAPLAAPFVQAGDLDVIAAKPDFLGANFYSRIFTRANPDSVIDFALDAPPAGMEKTEMSPVDPQGFLDMLLMLHERYDAPEMVVTEIGFAVDEPLPHDGIVEDSARVGYIRSYLDTAHEAYARGVNLKGIIYWSSTDNWEWVEGFAKRFGLIHIDHATLARIPKRSLEYWGRCSKANAVLSP